MNKKFLIYSLIVYIFALGLRIFYIHEKQGFHIDEIFSRITSINKRVESDYLLYVLKSFNETNLLKNYYFGKPKSSIISDLKQLRINNGDDDSHPSLYHSLLRIVLNFSNNENQFKLIGCGLNLIFFTFSFFIMRKLLIRLFGDNKLVPIGLAIAFLNTGTISATLFIRPYELQMLAVILLTYVYLLIVDKNKLNLKDFILCIFSLAFAFLAGYFLVLYSAMIFFLYILHNKKNYKNLLILLLSSIIALGITLFIYNGYFSFLNGQRFTGISHNTLNFYDYLFNFISYILNLLKFIFYGIIIILTLIAVLFFDKNIKTKHKSLFICALLWSFIADLIAPYPVLRYIVPVFPILALGIIFVIQKINLKKQNLFCTLFVLFYVVMAIFPIKTEANDTFITYNDKPSFVFLRAAIENLYQAKPLELDENLPVIINSRFWYSPMYIISRLNNNKQVFHLYVSETSLPAQYKHPSKHYYLFQESSLQQLFYENSEIKFLRNFLNYKIYEINIKS